MFSQVFVCPWGIGFPACIIGHMTSIRGGWLPSMHHRSHDQRGSASRGRGSALGPGGLPLIALIVSSGAEILIGKFPSPPPCAVTLNCLTLLFKADVRLTHWSWSLPDSCRLLKTKRLFFICKYTDNSSDNILIHLRPRFWWRSHSAKE